MNQSFDPKHSDDGYLVYQLNELIAQWESHLQMTPITKNVMIPENSLGEATLSSRTHTTSESSTYYNPCALTGYIIRILREQCKSIHKLLLDKHKPNSEKTHNWHSWLHVLLTRDLCLLFHNQEGYQRQWNHLPD